MPFSFRTLIVIALGGGFAVMANMLALVMVGQINEIAPERERIPYWGWGLSIGRKHKRLYPQSKLVYVFELCLVSTAICFPILLWSMGEFSRR
jgi:hypothetical protein